LAKKRARAADSSEDETVNLAGLRAERDPDRDTLHVPEDGNQVQVPDEAASSSHDVPRDAPLEAAAAAPLSEDEKDLQRVIQDIVAQNQKTDRDNIME
jgi:hypothetical protein